MVVGSGSPSTVAPVALRGELEHGGDLHFVPLPRTIDVFSVLGDLPRPELGTMGLGSPVCAACPELD